MGKTAPTSKPISDRHARAARAATKQDAAAAAKPLDGINDNVRRWKAAHIAETRAKIDNKRARDTVKDAMVAAGVDHVVTPYGTIPLQQRDGSTHVDWESLCRAQISPAVIAAELPKYVTKDAPSVVLSAPTGWSTEAKSAAA